MTWHPCEEPERPIEGGDCAFHFGCRACTIAAEARARRTGLATHWVQVALIREPLQPPAP